MTGIKRKDVLAFYRRHYRPQNLVLSLAGDFEAEPTLKTIHRLFGKQQAAVPRRRIRPGEPAQKIPWPRAA